MGPSGRLASGFRSVISGILIVRGYIACDFPQFLLTITLKPAISSPTMVIRVLVTGATGNQGGATARQLLSLNAEVHAIVRDVRSLAALELQKLGAKLFEGDFDNMTSLSAAVANTTAVFLNVTPSLQEPECEVRHAKNIIQVAQAAGTVTSIVYSSVTMTGKHESFPNWGPDFVMSWYWTNKAEIESLVRDSGLRSWTILRPAFLMYNYHLPFAAVMFPDLIERHTFLTAYKPTTAMMLLDPTDVGKFAAAAITDPPAYNGHEIDLGVEALTPEEIAQSLSKASGTQVNTEYYSSDEAASLALQNPLIASQLWTNEVGYKVDLKALEKYPIRRTTFAEYLEREKVAVLRTFNKNTVH
jgi:uncharacterized protein YbjT (DUF2867 family)